MTIFRAKIKATKTSMGHRKGQIVGFKLFDAKSQTDAIIKSRKIVGSGRKVIAITPTRLKGKVKDRYYLPRSKRYGSGYY